MAEPTNQLRWCRAVRILGYTLGIFGLILIVGRSWWDTGTIGGVLCVVGILSHLLTHDRRKNPTGEDV